MTMIPVDQIRAEAGAQMRVAMDAATISEYAEAMAAGIAFPAVIIFHDEADHWLADGFHRLAAAKQAGLSEILADVRQGNRRDAVLHAAGANATHGLRRSHADKRRAVVALLQDPEWARWSDREIGRACKVDGKTVAKVRAELTADFRSDQAGGEIPSDRQYRDRHGNTSTMKTATGSTAAKVLAGLSDDLLLAECHRRGWQVRRDI